MTTHQIGGYKVIAQPGTRIEDLTSDYLQELLGERSSENAFVILTLNPYDRIYLNWFRQQLYMKTSFEDFIRFRLYFALDTFPNLKTLNEQLENHSNPVIKDYRVIKQESLESQDKVFLHYSKQPYPLFGDKYNEKMLAIVNYLYRDEFSMSKYEEITIYQKDFDSKGLLVPSQTQMKSFEDLILKMVKEQNFSKAIRLIKQYPNSDRFRFQLGNSYIKNNQIDEGLEVLEGHLNSLPLDKRDILLEFIGMTYLRKKTDQVKALYYLEKIDNPPKSISQTVSLLRIMIPIYRLNKKTFIESEEEYMEERRSLINHLDLNLNDGSLPKFDLELPYNVYLLPNMMHAYHNQSNRTLFTKTAALYRKMFPVLTYQAPHCEDYRTPEKRGKKIKVGFLSNNFKNHSVTHSSSGVILNLDRSRYEVVLITYQSAVQKDFMWLVLYNSDSEYVALTGSQVTEHQKQVAKLELDILVYCDIGMNTNAYLLSFARLAPVQMLTWGHSDTSGVDTVDYYISSRLFELPDAQSHYSEKLLLHNSLSTYYYNRKASHQLTLNRQLDHYLIPKGYFISVISASVQKFHPEFDQVLDRILTMCPNLLLIVIMSGTKKIGDPNQVKLYQRWQTTLHPASLKRIQFLYHLSYDQFINLLQLSDLVLDTYPFGSCNTALDAFSVGKIMVACPSRLINGRFVSGFYEKMGVNGLVLDSLDAYVSTVVKCYADLLYRNELEQLIVEHRHLLYRDKESVVEWDKSMTDALSSLEN